MNQIRDKRTVLMSNKLSIMERLALDSIKETGKELELLKQKHVELKDKIEALIEAYDGETFSYDARDFMTELKELLKEDKPNEV